VCPGDNIAPARALAGFFCELFQALGMPVLEMHSRKSQSHRDKVAATFRGGAGQIMFSSDVSARGVDYPDVTMVVQVRGPAAGRAGRGRCRPAPSSLRHPASSARATPVHRAATRLSHPHPHPPNTSPLTCRGAADGRAQ
jgi:superfamily II DNA/RNA helicase